MEEFKLQSKPSKLGVVLKFVIYIPLYTLLYARVISRFIIESSLLYWMAILLGMAYVTYGYITGKSVLVIKDKKIFIEWVKGFPKQEHKAKFDLSNITHIKLIQTQNIMYGKKVMELTDTKGNVQTVELQFRYHQLLKLKDYLNDQLGIKTSLKG